MGTHGSSRVPAMGSCRLHLEPHPSRHTSQAPPHPVGSQQFSASALPVTLFFFHNNPQPAVKLLYNRSNNKYSYTR